MSFFVYRIRCGGVPYIGFTRDFSQRIKGHVRAARLNETESNFHRALRKYNYEYVVEEVKAFPTEFEALVAEIKMAEEYPCNYNKAVAGCGYSMVVKKINGNFIIASRKRKQEHNRNGIPNPTRRKPPKGQRVSTNRTRFLP